MQEETLGQSSCAAQITQCWQTQAPKATSGTDTVSLEDKREIREQHCGKEAFRLTTHPQGIKELRVELRKENQKT